MSIFACKNTLIFKRVLKRVAKIFAWTFGSIIGVLILLYALIQIPAIQKRLTDAVAGKVSSLIGLQVTVDRVFPIPWNGVALKDVVVCNSENDTILQSDGILAILDKLQLDSSYVALKKVGLLKSKINIEKNASGELNIASLLEILQSSDTTSKFRFEIGEITIRDANFSYRNLADEQSVGFGINFSNIGLSNLFVQAHSFSMYDGLYQLAVDKLSCNEQSGFELQYFHTQLSVCDSLIQCNDVAIYTPDTKLSAKSYSMRFDDFSDFSDFCEKVRLSANLNRTTVSLHDISYFAPSMQNLPYSFSVEGLVDGTVSDFSISDFHVGYGRSTQFVGTIEAKGLPNIDETNFVVDAKRFETNQFDITHTQIAPFDSEHYVSLPALLQNLTYYKYIGTIQGVWSDLKANGKLMTNAGAISTDAHLTTQGKTNLCVGSVAFEDFDLSNFESENPIFGKTTGKFDVDASFNSDSLIQANVVCGISKLECKDYAYSGLVVNGKLSAHKFFGKIAIDDPNLKMRFSGLVDNSKTIPEYRFLSRISNANLDKLNLFHDSLANVALTLSVDFSGAELDDMSGDVSIRDFRYSNAKGQLETKNVGLNVAHEDNRRTINLYSAFVNASIDGNGKYKDLAYSVLTLLKSHLDFMPSVTEKYSPSGDFTANVEVMQIDTILSLLQSDLRIAQKTKILARYEGEDSVCEMNIRSPRISYGGVQLHKVQLDCAVKNESIFVDAVANLDSLEKSKSKDLLSLQADVKKGDFSMNLQWNNHTAINTNGTVSVSGSMISKGEGNLPIFNMELNPTNIQVEDSVWNIAKSGVVVDDSKISITNFCLSKAAKKISVDGVISSSSEDVVVVNVENYDLSELNPIINNPRIRLAGPLHGRVMMKNLYATPLVFADVKSTAISFNDNLLGEMHVRSFWENREKALLMKASIQKEQNSIFAVEGKYIPNTDSVHFDIGLTDLNLAIFAEILQGTVDNISGIANGDVDVDGKLSNLSYSGEMNLANGSFLVNYTNVPYSFSGKLNARKTRFFFSDFSISDASKNTGIIAGFLDLKEISNPHYLFDIQTPKLLVMNTTAKNNEYFYGTVYYNGAAKIEGDLNETDISCQGKTLENSVCSIPVSYSELSGAYDFLFFSSDSLSTQTYEKTTSSSGLTMNLTLDVTPDAQAQIIFDPKVGDVIKARGAGNLQVKMDDGGDMRMYGKYQIENGDYLFTLKNLINKKLILQKGGTIVWNGDPLNAQVDLSANYETKASPQPLFDSTMNVSKRIPVTCQAHLRNNLLSPDISYDILVPSSATQVSEVLSTLSEDEKTLQFFSLLLQSSFMSVNSESGVGSSVSFEVLSNQFNNLLSQIDPNMDVNMNYRMGTDNVTNSEFEFGISRQFWNDRILVNVNGYTDFGGTNSTETVAQGQTNDFSGNVSVEMKLNKKGTIKVKGFSRSNDDELSEKQENTNGVGFFFTKDFNTIRDLFRKEE